MDSEGVYLSIDSILAEEERVDVRLEVDLFGMGWLHRAAQARQSERDQAADDDSGEEDVVNDSGDVPRGTELHMPLWLATPLIRRRFARPFIPQFFEEEFVSKVQSHPKSVNFRRDVTPHFYDFALSLNKALHTDPDEMLPLNKALQVFSLRALETCKNSGLEGHDAEEFRGSLAEWEQRVFDGCRIDLQSVRDWKQSSPQNRYSPYQLPSYLAPDKPQQQGSQGQ